MLSSHGVILLFNRYLPRIGHTGNGAFVTDGTRILQKKKRRPSVGSKWQRLWNEETELERSEMYTGQTVYDVFAKFSVTTNQFIGPYIILEPYVQTNFLLKTQ